MMDRDALKLLLDQGVSVEEIGRRFDRNASTIAHWMRKYGLDAPNREKYAAKGGIERDLLEELVAAGGTIASIATELRRSTATVRHWLAKYGLQTEAARRPTAIYEQLDDRTLISACSQHGQTAFRRDQTGRTRCLQCRQEYVVRRRRRVKAILVSEAGGSCALCGYDRYAGALQFHHRDPREKSFGLSEAGFARSLDAARGEARKCVLLCSNCHAEVEGRIASIPR